MARRPPQHLRDKTRAWWLSVVKTYELEDHHVKVLTLAAEAWDRATEARETLEREGSYFVDRFGQPKAHPAVAVERDSWLAFARLLRELDLDVEPAADPARPPMLRRYESA